MKKIMIAAPSSGSGKTRLTCSILHILKQHGMDVRAFKCGPDYIDPMFHRQILEVESSNLDTFFTGETTTRQLFVQAMKQHEFAVIEGVMGLFDGVGGVQEVGSSYHVAKVTNTPIVLVVNAKGMGKSILPLLAGFMQYDTEHLIRAVILNRTTASFYQILKPLIEEELGIRVLGYVPEDKESVASRHLGLILPTEISDLRSQIDRHACELARTVDVDKLIEIAETMDVECNDMEKTCGSKEVTCEQGPIIAVARDEAFCFYYEENMSLLKAYGARLVDFSPLTDETLPEGCSAMILGGGYPELYAKKLAQNEKMLLEIKRAYNSDMPVIAECGGFMYLHHAIQPDKKSANYKMVDILPGNCHNTERLVRFGYISVSEQKENFLSAGGCIRGHEFHYFDSECNGVDCVATKPFSSKSYECINDDGNHWMGFPHLYYPSNPEYAKRIVQKAAEYAAKSHN